MEPAAEPEPLLLEDLVAQIATAIKALSGDVLSSLPGAGHEDRDSCLESSAAICRPPPAPNWDLEVPLPFLTCALKQLVEAQLLMLHWHAEGTTSRFASVQTLGVRLAFPLVIPATGELLLTTNPMFPAPLDFQVVAVIAAIILGVAQFTTLPESGELARLGTATTKPVPTTSTSGETTTSASYSVTAVSIQIKSHQAVVTVDAIESIAQADTQSLCPDENGSTATSTSVHLLYQLDLTQLESHFWSNVFYLLQTIDQDFWMGDQP